MEINTITAFETTDKRIFRDFREAELHEVDLEKTRIDALAFKKVCAEANAKSALDLPNYIAKKAELAKLSKSQSALKKSVYPVQVIYTKKPTKARLTKLTKVLKNVETNKRTIATLMKEIGDLVYQNRGREGFPKHRRDYW